MRRTRIKICGITRPEDAVVAVAAGADAIGLVFWPHSQRAVDIATAQLVCAAVPAFVNVVALVVNASAEDVRHILNQVPVDTVQFHGDEDLSFCEQFAVPYIKAIRVKPELDIAAAVDTYTAGTYNRAVLLDTYRQGVPGGTGERFNWSVIPAGYGSHIILAGGLNAANVTAAVEQVQPYAVDVSGGVESAPGQKDPQAINAFVQAVYSARMNMNANA